MTMPGGTDLRQGDIWEEGVTTIQEHLTTAWKTAESDDKCGEEGDRR